MSDQTPPQVSSDAVPRRGLAIKVVAVVVVVALVLGAGLFAYRVLTGEPDRTVETPQTAADMQRNAELEGDAEFEAVRGRVASLFDDIEGASAGRVLVAAYDNADESRGPASPVFVIAGEIDGQIQPQQLLDVVRQNAQVNDLPAESVPAGEGAEGVCVTDPSSRIAGQCVWATSTSFGQVINPLAEWSPPQLADLMVQVRADVETTD